MAIPRPPSGVNAADRNLRRVRASLARALAGTGYAKLAMLGDSTVAGVGSGSVSTRSWPEQLGRLLASRGYPTAGSGFVAMYKEAGKDERWTFDSAWSDFDRSTFLMQQSGSAPAVFTSTNTGTAVDVIYGNSGGNFTVTVDGGAPATVTTTGGSTLATYTVTGLANTTHTVSITKTSGACHIFGAAVRTASSGVYLLNGGVGGAKSADLATSAWFGVVNAATAWGADCIFLMCQVNDAGNSVTAATHKTNIQAAITSAKAQGADVVLLTSLPPSGYDMSAYTVAAQELAFSNDVPLIDLSGRWGSYTRSNSLGLMTDGVHGSAPGYGEVAAAVLDLITSA